MQTMRIGFIGEYVGTYNHRVLHGLALYCRKHQWTLEVSFPTAENFAAASGAADGFVVGVHPLEGTLDHCFDRPTVYVSGHREHLAFPRVCTDDAAVGRMVADHLFDHGLRHLAFSGDPFGGWWSAQRQCGFTRRAGELGLGCSCFTGERKDGKPVAPPKTGLRDHAYMAWLRELPRPLGLMGCADGHAA
jgi:DNA-binding LacI/PurR family transcriptional regulator